MGVPIFVSKMGDLHGVDQYLAAADPLCGDACVFLLDYREEDAKVDYKANFDPKSEKCWIDLAIDAVSLANTHGGFLIFGVEDKTYRRIGLAPDVASALADTKVVLEKINRGVQPRLSEVRSKEREIGGSKFVFVFVPATKDATHVFESNRDLPNASGKATTIVRQGSIYVRGSGSNQILTAAGLEELLARRVLRFRDKLMEGISRVVHAEPTHEVIVVYPTATENGETTFRVSDAPDAIAIRGTSLATVPRTLEEQIAAWIAINQADANDLPAASSLMRAYAQRCSLTLSEDQCRHLAYFSLVLGSPVFYWLKDLPRNIVETEIDRAFTRAKNPERWYILDVSGFLGKTTYTAYKSRMSRMTRATISDFKDLNKLFKTGKQVSQINIEAASSLADKLSADHDAQKLKELKKLDCALYAPFEDSWEKRGNLESGAKTPVAQGKTRP